MRQKPSFTYCGLTVVTTRSRFDKLNLLSANGGHFFCQQVLRPEYNIHQCDVRLATDSDRELLPNTKCILILGDEAMKLWMPEIKNTLNEIRGSVFLFDEIPVICSYFPQDCVDIVDYEAQFNPYSDSDVEADEDEDEYGSEKSRHGRTKRRNYGFWLQKDTDKCKQILKSGLPKRSVEPNYILYPDYDIVIKVLSEAKDKYMFFDMETDKDLNMVCFSFSFGLPNIYIIPCYLSDYSWAYDKLYNVFRSLAIAIRDNILVAHNGSGFDFFVLAYKYKIPVKRVQDTMLMQHRCFPEAEKSLGHCTSLWTWEPFHKDEGNVPYLTHSRQIWMYCGKDVYTMALIHEAILKYASKRPGLPESIQQANNAIRPYLTIMLQGIRYRQDLLENIIKENDRLMQQYLRWLNILIGEETLKEIRGKGKSSMPSSSTQCCKYFHDMLGYPVIARGKEKQDGSRAPSLGKKAIFKLRLKYNNPVIDIVIAYRELAKESGSLKFNPWIYESIPITN